MKNNLSIRETILSKLMLSFGSKYSELGKDINNHDLFNYHLKELQKIGYVKKEGLLYLLTPEGRQQVALMEEDGSVQKPFKVGLFIALMRKNNGKDQMYLFKRLKHPHYGYSGDITAKLKWGESLEANLFRELEEELGIAPVKFKLIGVFKKSFKDENNKIMGEGVYFQYVVTEFIGIPKVKNEEGEYGWVDLDKVLTLKDIFRESLEFSIPKIKKYIKIPKRPQLFIEEQGKEELVY